jgi:hypothetical protein
MPKSKKKIVDITANDDAVIKNDVILTSPIENNNFNGDIKEEVQGDNATFTKTHTCVLSPIENNGECDTVIKNDAETVDKQTVVNELKKTVKTTNLSECPNCHKMITNKTLKYSHSKTCGIVKPSPDIIAIKQPDIIAIKQPDIIAIKQPDISAIKQVNKKKVTPSTSLSPQKIEITLDEMRRNYYINAKQQRTQRMQSLFANAI